ncbi:serine hydrolase [bacterium]|nr:serine hydrolase [bacterium]
MPKLAEKYDRKAYSQNSCAYTRETSNHSHANHYRRPNSAGVGSQRVKRQQSKKAKRNFIIHKIVSILFLVLLGMFVFPFTFNRVVKSFFFKSPYPQVKADYEKILLPTNDYLHNSLFLDKYLLLGAEVKNPKMLALHKGERLHSLENQLKNLALQYPSIHPSIFVWDYDTANYAGINSDEEFSAASIIKIPVLIQLFRSIEAGQLTIFDTMALTDYYRAEGSGSLQFKATDSNWSIDNLARIMITESDNSATNMLMTRIGSMTDVNSGIKEWGLNNTRINTWLPDMTGTNITTTEDLARMLYNIDNPNFLSMSSREKIFDYMGHVHNDRLIPAGLGAGAVFLHKTGDIGKMLGDAGIVYAPNGKKYIVAILANRPYNSPLGKDFIVKASEIIYRNMVR